ncbi:hypothetical protein [Albibacterium bauzanense]|uniref:Uncharacterized protein n=1 Tax=Albibacterium bauzanense TaxID=653929 RepID=A0A4R1M3B9_9SPHI|nr:hypothetical protein [Albibacterium bauzanense]TCK85732.1 hypothetical protein C8N28_1044 [Albibacterium bauzanense]
MPEFIAKFKYLNNQYEGVVSMPEDGVYQFTEDAGLSTVFRLYRSVSNGWQENREKVLNIHNTPFEIINNVGVLIDEHIKSSYDR